MGGTAHCCIRALYSSNDYHCDYSHTKKPYTKLKASANALGLPGLRYNKNGEQFEF